MEVRKELEVWTNFKTLKSVQVLNMLRKHFIRPIVSIRDQDKKVIFINIKELGEAHGGFYKEMLEAVTGKSRKRVGEVRRVLNTSKHCRAEMRFPLEL